MDESIRFRVGSTLMNEGESGDVAYVIRKGRVRITKESPLGPQELAILGPGQVVGEMALVDDKPRSATATALDDVIAKPIQRGKLLDLLRSDAELAMSLLQVLFERLRLAQSVIVDLKSRLGESYEQKARQQAQQKTQAKGQQADSGARPPTGSAGHREPPDAQDAIVLKGLTDRARHALPDGGLNVDRLPLRVGRVSNDPLARNDLSIPDSSPYQVSRCHIAIYRDEDLVAITDRGSKDGFAVNGQHYGGEGNPNRIAYLNRGKNRLTLGDSESEYRFELTVGH